MSVVLRHGMRRRHAFGGPSHGARAASGRNPVSCSSRLEEAPAPPTRTLAEEQKQGQKGNAMRGFGIVPLHTPSPEPEKRLPPGVDSEEHQPSKQGGIH